MNGASTANVFHGPQSILSDPSPDWCSYSMVGLLNSTAKIYMVQYLAAASSNPYIKSKPKLIGCGIIKLNISFSAWFEVQNCECGSNYMTRYVKMTELQSAPNEAG
ncbi:hypothetical protein RRG08_020109 [Elysia crispata]|uniref:Uncharacterized protein n=1 Tax=Elysia crispata TaxID=231223 RepID=A0AAE1DSE5_9GAST|nr:hypothetical protein RRG08_020109 [Elysia crispata]